MKKFLSYFLMVILLITACVPANVEAKTTAGLNKTKVTLYVGQTTKLKVSGIKGKVKWSTSKKKVATVSKGKVTAKKAGKAKISAKVGKKTFKCTVTVKNPALSAKKVSLYVGASQKITLNGGKIKSVKSSNPAVATITKGGVIRGLKAGSATLTITSTKKKNYTCNVVVSNKPAASTAKKPETTTANKPETNPTPDSNLVTRDTFFTRLVDFMELDAVEGGNYSFDDERDSSDPGKLERAYQSGFAKITTDRNNISHIYPKRNITREDAAYAIITALGFTEINSDMLPSCADMSSLTYADQDLLAVQRGLILLVGNQFKPLQALTIAEQEKLFAEAEKILNTNPGDEEIHEIDYANDVDQVRSTFEVNEDGNQVTLPLSSGADEWEVGNVYVIHDPADSSKDIAVKVTDIDLVAGNVVVSYTTPELEEVIDSMDVQGSESHNGTLTPAEGVTVEYVNDDGISTQAVADGSVDLFNKLKISLNVKSDDGWEGSFVGYFMVKNLEYRFNVSPSWKTGLNLNEVYFALNSHIEGDVIIGKPGFSTSASEGEGVIRQKIADIDVPIGYGFSGGGSLYVKISTKGTFEVAFSMDSKNGAQYSNADGFRLVNKITNTQVGDPTLKGSFKVGPEFDLGIEFLGIDTAKAFVYAAFAADAKLYNLRSTPSSQFCIDAKAYIYVTIGVQIGPKDLNLKIENEVLNSTNSVWKKTLAHIEETGFVPKCTRGSGSYSGYVKEAVSPNKGINNAKITVKKDGQVYDKTYTDVHGEFHGVQLPAGTYTISVAADGYRPYEHDFNIVGGQTTTLEPQLMLIDSGDSGSTQTFTCSGIIRDAYTGSTISGATIKVLNQSTIVTLDTNTTPVATTTSDSNGRYSVSLPSGMYQVVVSKADYVTNALFLTLAASRNDANVTLNPTNLPEANGNLRVVLTWGEEPYDLDSHMVQYGSTTGHCYYIVDDSGKMSLDVDETSSYGPETITLVNAENEKYSYYVHDYSNRNSDYSTALSNSGAKITIYAGNILLYTINVPTNREGTLWHVFDYDATTDRINLVNSFSYESDPSYVGSNIVVVSDGEEKDHVTYFPDNKFEK